MRSLQPISKPEEPRRELAPRVKMELDWLMQVFRPLRSEPIYQLLIQLPPRRRWRPTMAEALRSRLLDQLDRPRRPSRLAILKPSPLIQRRQAWLHRKTMPKRKG